MSETYTINILKQHIHIHKNYLRKLEKLSKKYNVTFRKPVFPEAISENIIKNIIMNKYKCNITWDCTGDLYSKQLGKIECKAFASDGPISFGHNQNWNIIFFLDLNQWYSNNKIKLYQLDITNDSLLWLNIQINKNDNIKSIYSKKQRAKISWKQLYPQIKNDAKIIYDGSIDQIFCDSYYSSNCYNFFYYPILYIYKFFNKCFKKNVSKI